MSSTIRRNRLPIAAIVTFAVLPALTGLPTASAANWGDPSFYQPAATGTVLQMDANDVGGVAALWGEQNAVTYDYNLSWAYEQPNGHGVSSATFVRDARYFSLAQNDGATGTTRVLVSRNNGTNFTTIVYGMSSGAPTPFARILDTNPNAGDVRAVADGSNTTLIWGAQFGGTMGLKAQTWWGNGTLTPNVTLFNSSPSLYSFDAASNGRGTTAVVWTQGGFSAPVGVRTMTAGGVWSGQTNLSTDCYGSSPISVGVDPNGNITVLWVANNRTALLGIQYSPGTGWGSPIVVRQLNFFTEYFGGAKFTYDGSGGFRITYRLADGFSYDNKIETMTYSPAAGWGTPDVLFHGFTLSPSITGDSQGNAVVLSGAYTAGSSRLEFRRFVVGEGWRTSERVPGALTASPYQAAGQVVTRSPGTLAFGVLELSGPGPRFVLRNFTLDNTPPVVQIYTPSGGTVVNSPTVFLSGMAEPGAVITIGQVKVATLVDGSFWLQVALMPGGNMIIITAVDESGNLGWNSVIVTFDDPYPVLTDDIAGVQTNVSSLLTEQAAAQADLAAAQASITALGNAVNVTVGQLLVAQSDVIAAQARLTDLESSGNATQADLDAAAANVTAAQSAVDALQILQAAQAASLADAAANATAAAARAQAASDSVAAAYLALNQTKADLATTRSDLAAAQAQLASQQASVNASEQKAASASTSAASASAAAASAASMAMLALLVGAAGIGVGALGMMRKKAPTPPAAPAAEPPKSP